MSYEGLREALRQEGLSIAAQAAAQGAVSRHGPSIGTGREKILTDHLQVRFPGLAMTRGEILAPGTGPSSEWDLILYDNSSHGPLAGAQGSPIVAIETVVAVVSVKSQLRSDSIDECARAAAQLRGMLVQDAPGVLVPAVFAFGFDGATGPTVNVALDEAMTEHGKMGRIDGLLVLGKRLATPDHDRYAVDEAGEDAYGRWVAVLDGAVSAAPRRRVALAAYLGPPPPRGDDGSDEDGPVAPPPPPPPGSPPPSGPRIVSPRRPSGGSEVPPESQPGPAAATTASGLALEQRPVGTDLRASRSFAILAEDVRQRAGDEDASRFATALSDVGALRALAREATGPLLESAAMGLSLAGEVDHAVAAFRRHAETADDPAEALAMAAATLSGSGDSGRATALLDEIDAPGHPAVRLVGAASLEDPANRLQQVEEVEAESPWQRRLQALLRASALFELKRDDELVALAREALAQRWTLALAQWLASVLIRPHGADLGVGDDGPFEVAAATLVDVTREELALGRPDNAMVFDANLVAVLARLRRHADISALIAWWQDSGDIPSRSPRARTALASALLDAQRHELALLTAPPPEEDDAEGRLLGLRLDLYSDDASVVSAAVAALDEMLDAAIAAGEDAERIAHARAVAAVEHGASWSDDAGAVIAEASPMYRDMLLSAHLIARGDRRAAETTMLPYADSAPGIRSLIDLAVRAEDWQRVVDLVEGALGDAAPPVERLRRADALDELGDAARAAQAWRELAEADDTPEAMREHAWFRHARVLAGRQQWEDLASATEAWAAAMPGSAQAAWAAADALGRVGRAGDALALLRAADITPSTPEHRHLVARLAADALPLQEALQVIADLSDAVGREDELLEAMLIMQSAGKDKANLPPALEERVRLTFADFPQRFPDSSYVRSIRAPSTDDEWAEFAERYLTERRDWADTMAGEVVAGRAALAALAVAGRTTLGVWLESDILPLAFNDEQVHEHEVAAADSAIAGAAAWDVSALAVLSLLPPAAAAAAARALPASVTARAGRREVDEAVACAADRHSHRSTGSLGWDPTIGRPVLVAHTEEAAAAHAMRVARVAEIASRLAVADPAASGEGPAAHALRDEQIRPSAASWLGAIVLAAERQIPLFSDDRLVRAHARAQETASFGTLALIEALHRRGAIETPDRDASFWALREAGGRHVPLRSGELGERIAADGFRLSRAVDATLSDPEGWRPDPDHQLTEWTSALRAVSRHEPELMWIWIGHVLSRLSATVDRPISSLALIFLNRAILDEAPDVAYSRALIHALRRCRRELLAVGDPIELMLTALSDAAGADAEIRKVVFVRALAALPIPEQLRILGEEG